MLHADREDRGGVDAGKCGQAVLHYSSCSGTARRKGSSREAATWRPPTTSTVVHSAFVNLRVAGGHFGALVSFAAAVAPLVVLATALVISPDWVQAVGKRLGGCGGRVGHSICVPLCGASEGPGRFKRRRQERFNSIYMNLPTLRGRDLCIAPSFGSREDLAY